MMFYKISPNSSFSTIGIYTNFIVQRYARREEGIQLHGREDWIPSLVSGFRLPCRNDGVLQKLCRYLCFFKEGNFGNILTTSKAKRVAFFVTGVFYALMAITYRM